MAFRRHRVGRSELRRSLLQSSAHSLWYTGVERARRRLCCRQDPRIRQRARRSLNRSRRAGRLKFVLHFVGDLHQPLHSSDDHDRGGNDKRVSAAGFRAGNLHHYWDTEFVDQLGPDAKTIASDLIGHITRDQVMQWRAGDVPDWAQESFRIAKSDAYGQLPEPNARGSFRLSDDYVTEATQDVSLQLSKAGVRLALILNNAFRKP